jgi:hypothetical protein
MADDRPLPDSFSLSQYILTHFDQGDVGSCFANAAAQIAQIDMQFGDPSRYFPVSRRLVWQQGRKLDNSWPSRGDGGSVCNAVACLADSYHNAFGDGSGAGAAHEDLWPYKDDHNWLEAKPPQSVLDDAAKTRFTQYAEVAPTVWQRQIYSGRAVDMGTFWPLGWDSAIGNDGRATGIGKLARDGLGRPGGHSYTLTGWATWSGQLWYQFENSHGPIYHPLTAELAASVPGYKPAGATGINGEPDMTFDFWVRADWYLQLFQQSQEAEAFCVAGPEGFTRRDPIDPTAIMPVA